MDLYVFVTVGRNSDFAFGIFGHRLAVYHHLLKFIAHVIVIIGVDSRAVGTGGIEEPVVACLQVAQLELFAVVCRSLEAPVHVITGILILLYRSSASDGTIHCAYGAYDLGLDVHILVWIGVVRDHRNAIRIVRRFCHIDINHMVRRDRLAEDPLAVSPSALKRLALEL